MQVKVVIYQQELIARIPKDDFNTIKIAKPDVLCLPEYFFHPDFISYNDSLTMMLG